MTTPRSDSLFKLDHWLIFILPLILILSGVACCFNGYKYPLFNNQTIVQELFHSGGPPECLTEDERQKWGDSFWYQVSKYQTPREPLINSGLGLVSLGLSLIIFALIFKIHRFQDLQRLESPKSPIVLIALLNSLIILGGLAGLYNVFSKDDGYHYPPWADRMGIPVFTTILGVILDQNISRFFFYILKLICF